jgi:nucleotide-binding universal stress UspA family protein
MRHIAQPLVEIDTATTLNINTLSLVPRKSQFGMTVASAIHGISAVQMWIQTAMNIRQILLPTDFSDCNKPALEYASMLAAENGATLHILHVDDLQDVSADQAEFGYLSPTPWDHSDRVKVREELDEVQPTITGVACERHYRRGTPATQIVRFAKTHDMHLIVMASHGRTGLARLIMGSVAEGVMRKAPCPILIVKQPKEKQAQPVTGRQRAASS